MGAGALPFLFGYSLKRPTKSLRLAAISAKLAILALIRLELCAEFSAARSEEHTSELQSRGHLVCRLLLDPLPPHFYTLSLHDALPISVVEGGLHHSVTPKMDGSGCAPVSVRL